MTITCKSRWKKGDKNCTVFGTKNQNSDDYTFVIRGWNPLPCKKFTGSYTILAKWLMENGWVRDRYTGSPFEQDVLTVRIESCS